jgi:hypothetical protein
MPCPHLLVMSNNSQPRCPSWCILPCGYVFEHVFLLQQDNVICLALLDSLGESGHPCTIFVLLMIPLDTLTVTYGGTSDVRPLSNAYKIQIKQFQDIYDHCNSQTAWSDHNIFEDLTSSHFDFYCFLISHNHDWSPPVLPLWHHTYAPACHQIPLVSPKCSNDGGTLDLSPVPNTFLWNHTTFMMRHLMHLPKWWIWHQWTAK